MWINVKKMILVKEFIQKLKDVSNHRDYWKFKKKHFLLIQDKSWVDDVNSNLT